MKKVKITSVDSGGCRGCVYSGAVEYKPCKRCARCICFEGDWASKPDLYSPKTITVPVKMK